MSTYRIQNNGDDSGTIHADKITVDGDRLIAWTNKQITLVLTLHRHARVELVKASK